MTKAMDALERLDRDPRTYIVAGLVAGPLLYYDVTMDPDPFSAVFYSLTAATCFYAVWHIREEYNS